MMCIVPDVLVNPLPMRQSICLRGYSFTLGSETTWILFPSESFV